MPGNARIAIRVDEPTPGQFCWVLMEEGDDPSHWVTLESAEKPCDLWLDALEAGVRALVGYAPEERNGPPQMPEDEDADPVGGSIARR